MTTRLLYMNMITDYARSLNNTLAEEAHLCQYTPISKFQLKPPHSALACIWAAPQIYEI